MILYLKNVTLGKNCKFYGIPIFNRSYNSKITIGDNCTFRSDKTSNLIGLNRKCIISTFGENSKIKIGKNSGFSGTVIGAANSITIGNNVLSGANVLITDFDWHPIDPKTRHTNIGVKNAPIVIADNVWLGINSVILKGVTIGENSVIGANSVVVKDIPANVIAAGNPCKIIKKLE
ncbi:acyltransferase [Aureibaculum marinum]|uniref:acyltransferase n=1 Tax=Aureibaculum marinum TaxID=2487930 RepID=UPI001EEFF0B1|nr:acyltransferase [Aureibaculum marinum]